MKFEPCQVAHARAVAGARAVAAALVAAVGLSSAVHGEPVNPSNSAGPQQTPAKLAVELNKLEPGERGCRVYLVVNNEADIAYSAYKLDLAIFQPDGVYAQGLKLNLAPIKAAKRSVRMFDTEGLACDRLGSILVNDAVECRSDAGPVGDCLAGLTLTSLATVKISK